MPGITAHLVDVATGRQPANLYIENGSVLNVYSGEILEAGVAVAAGRVAYVGPSRRMIGEDTAQVDAAGGILVPGYIDPHAHADFVFSLPMLAETALPLGTTTIVCDTQAMATRHGAAGLAYLRATATRLPLHVYLTVPVVDWVPDLRNLGCHCGQTLSDEELAAYLRDELVLGTAEFLPWRELLGEEALPHLQRLELARACGKLREGHNVGATADRLQALAAAGITACHEALTAAEALDRLRAGMYVMLRHGPARFDLPALAPLVLQAGVDRSRLMLTQDWYVPGDLIQRGYMDYLIATAIELGVPPLDAYRMATINAARYWRIEDHVGAIAPGRCADILCLNSLDQPRPRWVLAAGKRVAEGGRPVPGWLPEGPWPTLPPYRPADTTVTPAAFRLRTDRSGPVRVPAIEVINKTVTRRVDLELPVRGGAVDLGERAGQVLKIAIPRPEDGFAISFLVGVGARLGGFASTLGSEPFPTLVLGSNDADMALAYNRMVELGGGVVAVEDGEPLLTLPTPIGGFISNLSFPEIAERIEAVNRWARSRGSTLEDFFLTHHFLTFVGVPFFRMTPGGIYDVKERAFLPPVLG